LKRWLKHTAARGVGRWTSASNGPRVIVLCYHCIDKDKDFASATPELFEQHLSWLSRNCRVVPLETALARARASAPALPEVAITFDDGYADNFECAFPLLRKFGMNATFFLTAGLMEQETGTLARFQQLRQAPYEAIRPMNWKDVREMVRHGMEVGAHTYSHPNLAQLSAEDARKELRWSKDIIEQRLGQRVRSLAYPFGKPDRHFSSTTTEIALEEGYDLAAAIIPRSVAVNDSCMKVPRFFVARDDLGSLREKVLGWWNIMGSVQERMPLALARILSPLDFLPLPTVMPNAAESSPEGM